MSIIPILFQNWTLAKNINSAFELYCLEGKSIHVSQKNIVFINPDMGTFCQKKRYFVKGSCGKKNLCISKIRHLLSKLNPRGQNVVSASQSSCKAPEALRLSFWVYPPCAWQFVTVPEICKIYPARQMFLTYDVKPNEHLSPRGWYCLRMEETSGTLCQKWQGCLVNVGKCTFVIKLITTTRRQVTMKRNVLRMHYIVLISRDDDLHYYYWTLFHVQLNIFIHLFCLLLYRVIKMRKNCCTSKNDRDRYKNWSTKMALKSA